MIKILNTIWKSLIIGLAYLLAMAIGGMTVNLVDLNLPETENVQATLMWTFVGGIIAGLFLGPIAAFFPISRTRNVIIWGSVVFFNLVSVAIEGFIFAPELVEDSLPGLFTQLLVTALATGWVVTILFAPKRAVGFPARVHHPLFSMIWRFLASALGYAVFYFIFGVLNYELVTKPYYETHAGGLTVLSPETVLMAEFIRGVLIVLSVFPFLLTLRANKKRLVLLTGSILFSIGGLVPLTMQTGALPFILLAASAVEILFQNFSTGTVTALLLGQSE